ncbi:heat shock factor-binding protein 1-like [Carassius carassius]|uniref:heat shock factor-binding protein 1-like n=1 Tax=Carassius carassius TaxID=217509 RepID=UPI0028689305|nr:heat shock factor-binding protein 1-like [Carassius carassius]
MSEKDPKTSQDLTFVVQTLLQQMQDKFQTMSDQIIGRNILPDVHVFITVIHLAPNCRLIEWNRNLNLLEEKSCFLNASLCDGSLFKMCFLLIQILDEMSTRIDDLEKNISDLMSQAGVEESEEEIKVTETSGTA